jgi:hypothetical protein
MSTPISPEAFDRLVEAYHKLVDLAIDRKAPGIAPTPTPSGPQLVAMERKAG